MSDRSTQLLTNQDAVTITSTTTGTGHLVSRYFEANVYLDVTAASGGDATLDVTVQSSPVQSNGPWVTVATFTQITSAGDYMKAITGNLGEYLRIVETVAGSTPSFTLSSYILAKT